MVSYKFICISKCLFKNSLIPIFKLIINPKYIISFIFPFNPIFIFPFNSILYLRKNLYEMNVIYKNLTCI